MNEPRDPVSPVYGVAINRRRLLGGAIAVAGGLAVSSPTGSAFAAGRPSRLRLTLPAPTGPHDIGTVSLHLIDHARQDPFLPTPHPRELMVSVWYPARKAGRRLTPWMPAAALAYYRQELETVLASPPGPSPDVPPPPAVMNSEVSLDGVDFPITHAAEAAPVDRSAGPYPVVFFSPGADRNREQGTALVEELASHGYVVVTISHTYQAGEVEFPDGRVERGRPQQPPHVALSVRIADTRFVIDSLVALKAGHNPDAEHRPLPGGLRACMDTARIGMFGHSLGGATAAQIMAQDPRVRAGVNLDGSFFPDGIPLEAGPEEMDKGLKLLASRIGDRPFMIMASGGFGPDYFGDLTSTVWHNLRGWRRFISLIATTHLSYTDDEPLLSQLMKAGMIPTAAPWIGETDPERTVTAQRAYIRAFFDLWLRNRGTHLLDGPSAQYPEAKFYPPA